MRAPVPEKSIVRENRTVQRRSLIVVSTWLSITVTSHGSSPRTFNARCAHDQNRRTTSSASSKTHFVFKLTSCARTQPIPALVQHPPQRVQRYKDKYIHAFPLLKSPPNKRVRRIQQIPNPPRALRHRNHRTPLPHSKKNSKLTLVTQMHTEYTRAVQRATEKEQRLQAEIKCVPSPASIPFPYPPSNQGGSFKQHATRLGACG